MSDRDERAAEMRITVGELRSHLRNFGDDCEIYIGSEEGELFFCRTKSRDRDKNDKSTLMSLELVTANQALDQD